MNHSEAQEQLEMVDRILERADRRPFRPIGALLIAWGFAAAIMDAGEQAYASSGVRGYEYTGEIALLVAMLVSILVTVSIVRNADRMPANERRMGRVLAAVWIGILVAAFAQPHVFGGWAGAGVWTLGAAITMLISGFSGDRRAVAGGVILLASLLVGNYLVPDAPGYALAAGMLLGYAIPGTLFAVQGAPGDA